MISDDFKDAKMAGDYMGSKRANIADGMEQVAWVLKDLFRQGVNLRVSESPQNDNGPTVYLHEQTANIAIRIEAPKGSVLFPGVEGYWEMQRKIDSLGSALRQAQDDLRMEKFIAGKSDEVL